MRYTISQNSGQQPVHNVKAKPRLSPRQRKQQARATQRTKTTEINWSDLGILSETWATIDDGGDKSVVSSLTAEQHFSNFSNFSTTSLWFDEGSMQPQDPASNYMEGVQNSLNASSEKGTIEYSDSNSSGSPVSILKKNTKKPPSLKQQVAIASIIESKSAIKRQHHWMEQMMGRKAILREEGVAMEYLESVHTHLQQLLVN